MKIPLEWEQDFAGLEEWLVINKNKIGDYLKVAKSLNIKMVYKKKNKTAMLFCSMDQDMTEFWEKLNELNNEN